MKPTDSGRIDTAVGPRRSLLLLAGLLVLGALAAVLMVQLRQNGLVSKVVEYERDYAVIALTQLEIEYLRLREAAVLQADGAAEPGPSQDLQLRYDIFVSRIGLFEGRHARALLDSSARSAALLHQLEAFVAEADEWLPVAVTGQDGGHALDELRNGLQALDEPIHQLMIEATLQAATHVSDRTQQMRQYQRSTLVFGGVLAALVLLSAALVLRQVRALQRAHRRLLDLTGQLRQARIEAETANEAKSMFLADMSHELRTPLHGLLGLLALLRQPPAAPTTPTTPPTPASGDTGTWLATAQASAQHLQRLLDELLDLGKLEAGTLTLTRETVQLQPLLAEVVQLMRPLAEAKSLQLDWQFDPTLPPSIIGDATRLRQILYNLISNALKFSDQGRVEISARRQPTTAGLDSLLLEVRDHGIGIDAQTLRQLFRRYSRSADPQVAQAGGNGLGLSISRNLALLMGGELGAQSRPGEGSVFRLRLPLLPATAAAQAPVPGPTPTPTASAVRPALAETETEAKTETETRPVIAPTPLPWHDPAARGSPPDADGPAPVLRVLVADDHPVNRLYLQALLDHMGHASTLAENGRIALEHQRDDAHDLVLMDVHMPVMDGIAAMQAIRALPPAAGRVPMLALTADVFAQTRERCLAAGADDVLTKPLSLDVLQAALERHAGVRAVQAAPERAAPGATVAADRVTAAPPGPVPPGAPPAPAAPGRAADSGAPGTPPPSPVLLDEQASLRLRTLLGMADARGLYRGFFEHAEDAARRIDQACRERDVQGLRRAAHTVKGAALNLGLPALGACAERLSREDLQLQPGHEQQQAHEFARLLRASREHCLQHDLLH
ncbi:ATP-binding protein [Pseudaquabacterium rugosum]|uniref:histidine kinase n=1 Tax=Pseudaquabacterium rugosum TaxID=2984194 RepID=A0ABU9B705_9BURK